MDLGTTLIFTGLYNIASGLVFGIPMPVQPMKAIAAIALADEQMRLEHVIAAGIFVSSVTFLLGITRLINVFNWCGSFTTGNVHSIARQPIHFLAFALP